MAALFFFTIDGCPACDAATPDFHKFQAEHPEVLCLRLSADGPYPAHFGVRVRATPTYAARSSKAMRDFHIHEGKMTADQIKKWMKKEGLIQEATWP